MEAVVAREALVVPTDAPPGRRRSRGAARKAVLFVAALVLVASAWELYKLVGPKDGGEILGWSILPRSNDVAMPHVWDMGSRLFDPESRTSDTPIWRVVLAGAWYSFRLAVVGFAIGSAVGIGLATVMARFDVVRRGLAAVPRRLPDRADDRPRAARRQLGWAPVDRVLGVAALAVGVDPRRVPGLLPRRRRDPARSGVGVDDLARADAQLRRHRWADDAQAALPGRRAADAARRCGWQRRRR